MSDLPTAQRADSPAPQEGRITTGQFRKKTRKILNGRSSPIFFAGADFPRKRRTRMGQDSAWRRGDSFCFRLRKKRKKEKKAIRHRGVGAPNKGMSRNRSRDSMGLIGPGKTMLRSGPLQGSGAPTSVREWDLPSHGFSRQLRCPKVSKGERREDARRVALGQPGLPLAD